MNFINIPNLPESSVNCVLLDKRASVEILDTLRFLNIKVILSEQYEGLYPAISCHPDIMLHHTGGNRIVHAPGVDKRVLKELTQLGFELVSGSTVLASGYPGNIAYNAARIGNHFFHNLKHTDPVLLTEMKKAGLELVHINQGYAKCSISVVDSNSLITSDPGIVKAAESKGIETLFIEQDENIHLPGFKNGFIGGCSGLIAKDTWAVSGDFNTLSSAGKIYDFIKKKNIKILSLSKGGIYDIGSIVPLTTVT